MQKNPPMPTPPIDMIAPEPVPGAIWTAARTLTGLTQDQLAKEAGISLPTIKLAESSKHCTEKTRRKLNGALMAHRVFHGKMGENWYVFITQPKSE